MRHAGDRENKGARLRAFAAARVRLGMRDVRVAVRRDGISVRIRGVDLCGGRTAPGQATAPGASHRRAGYRLAEVVFDVHIRIRAALIANHVIEVYEHRLDMDGSCCLSKRLRAAAPKERERHSGDEEAESLFDRLSDDVFVLHNAWCFLILLGIHRHPAVGRR